MEDEKTLDDEGLETPPTNDGDGDPKDEGAGTDWEAKYREILAEKRQWEKRSRSNHKKAETAASESADAIARAEAAEKELADLKAEAARSGLVSEIAKAKGVDASILGMMIGDKREAIEANADALASLSTGNSYPKVKDKGENKQAPVTKEDILAIENPSERRKMMAQHLDLFN